ncbi:MAG TPA: cytochrome P450 [Ktedonobacterales bacterium]|nr:cytochrome P450 [Ktedonobacterales bacterium]
MKPSVVQPADATGKTPLPPIVPGFPLLGNTLAIFRNPVALFAKMYQELGPIFRVRVPGREYTVLAGPEATLLLAQSDEDYFSSHEVFTKVMKELRTENFIAALEGAPHRHQRKILKPSLSREAVNRYIPRMLQITEQAVHAWQPGQRVRIKPTMQFLVSQQLGLAMTNHALGERFHDAVTFAETLVGAGAAGTWPAIMLRRPAYRAAKGRVVALMQRLIDERRAQGPDQQGEREPDLLDVLLAARDLEGQPLTDVDLIVGVQLPYIAGMDTAAATASFLLYELLKHPALLEKVVAEIDEAFAGGIPNAQTFRQMPTLHSAAMETFRLYPVVSAAPRYARRSFEFQGYHIEQGQRLLISTTTSHFLPRFFPNPTTFDVERYSAPRNEHRQPGAYAPFAAGPHTCVASGLAEVVVMTTVAALLHTARLALDPPTYTLKTTINPLPRPEGKFRVRILEQRMHQAALARPSRTLSAQLARLLPTLSREQITQLKSKVEVLTYPPGTTIIRQGEPPDKFYMMLNGMVEVIKEQPGQDPQIIARLDRDSFFGEIGLLQGINRSATVRTADDSAVTLMALSREDFTTLVTESDLTSQEIDNVMRWRLLSDRLADTTPSLSPEQGAQVVASSELIQYAPGASIVQQGDPPEKFYIVAQGACEVITREPDGQETLHKRLSNGDQFGETNLLQGVPHTATVRAASENPVEILALDGITFTTLLAETGLTVEDISRAMLQHLINLRRRPT